MQTIVLTARDTKSDTNAIRTQGGIPAVMYGRDTKTGIPVTTDSRTFIKAFQTAGFTSVVTLTGVDGDKEALIHDVAYHPVTSTIEHIDFYLLAKGQKVTLEIPLVFSGLAPAEKLGAIIVRVHYTVTVEAEPKNLPHELHVDLTKLENVHDVITAGSIVLPEGAVLKMDTDEVIVSATEEKKEREIAAPVADAATATAAPAAPEQK